MCSGWVWKASFKMTFPQRWGGRKGEAYCFEGGEHSLPAQLHFPVNFKIKWPRRKDLKMPFYYKNLCFRSISSPALLSFVFFVFVSLDSASVAFLVAEIRAQTQMTGCDCGGSGNPYPPLQLLSSEPLCFKCIAIVRKTRMFGGEESAVSWHWRWRAFRCQLLAIQLLLAL